MTQQQNKGAENIRAPQLVIPMPVWQKMMCYILNCPYEINGFGTVTTRGNVIYVDDVFILDQVVTAASVETVQTALDEHVYNLAIAGGDPGAIKFQWHSHVQMVARFSTVDTANIARWPGNWLVSLVANQRGEFSCQLDINKPLAITVPLQPHIPSYMPQGMTDAVRSDIERLVKQPQPTFGKMRRRPRDLVPVNDGGPLWGDLDDYDLIDPNVRP